MSTEEEQIEALKQWWNENGTSIMIGVALVVVSFFGWNQWTNSRNNHATEASDLYQQVLELVANAPAYAIPEDDVTTVAYLNEQLRTDYVDTIYARYSALFMAKLHVDANELAQAEQQLSWVIDNPDIGMFNQVDDAMLMTARSRLARVVLAQGDAQRALDLLQAADSEDFLSTYAEIEGDAYTALGQIDQAKAAYQRALDAGSTNALLQLKLSDLGV